MSNTASSDNSRPSVVAVASFGGHLVQLTRIMEQFSNRYDIKYISTSESAKPENSDKEFFIIDDFYRTNPWLIFKAVKKCRKFMKRTRPSAVITTGAAPGLAAIIAARSLGIRSLWIDSIANIDKLSMSGRIASHIATSAITQWPDLQTDKVKYAGTVI